MDDTSKYVNTTVNEVDNFALHNLDELMLYFNTTLDEAGNSTRVLVDDTLIAINFDEIENITNFIYNVSVAFANEDKNASIDLLELLKGDVSNLSTNLQDVIDELSKIHDDPTCQADPSGTCTTTVDGLKASLTNIKSGLEDFKTIDEAIDSLKDIDVDLTQIEQMVQLINDAKESITDFSEQFVNNFTQGITNDIVDITDDIKAQVTNLTDKLKNIDLNNTETIQDIGNAIDSFANYTDIILYTTLVPAIILGLALLFSCFGLILGAYKVYTLIQ